MLEEECQDAGDGSDVGAGLNQGDSVEISFGRQSFLGLLAGQECIHCLLRFVAFDALVDENIVQFNRAHMLLHYHIFPLTTSSAHQSILQLGAIARGVITPVHTSPEPVRTGVVV